MSNDLLGDLVWKKLLNFMRIKFFCKIVAKLLLNLIVISSLNYELLIIFSVINLAILVANFVSLPAHLQFSFSSILELMTL